MTLATAVPVQEALDLSYPDSTTQEARKAATTSTPHACGGCGSRWGGFNTAHCSAAGCHRTFGGVSGFDAHRKDGECLNPETIGMFLTAGRPYPCWSLAYGDGGDDA